MCKMKDKILDEEYIKLEAKIYLLETIYKVMYSDEVKLSKTVTAKMDLDYCNNPNPSCTIFSNNSSASISNHNVNVAERIPA